MKLTNTKQMRDAYRRYRNSTATTLYDVYSSFSKAKADACDYCKELMYKYDGQRFRIIGANARTFSAGFEFADPNTGEACFCWITKENDRYMYIGKDDLD